MERRVYYHDTDAGGVVYYGNYLKFLEESRTEFLEQRGLSVTSFRDQGHEFVVRKCTVHYRHPARYGDVVVCEATMKKITSAQIFFNQTLRLKETGRLLVEAEVVLACIKIPDFKPTQIPESMKSLLV